LIEGVEESATGCCIRGYRTDPSLFGTRLYSSPLMIFAMTPAIKVMWAFTG